VQRVSCPERQVCDKLHGTWTAKDTGWQRDLSVSYERIGDVQGAQDNLPAALTTY